MSAIAFMCDGMVAAGTWASRAAPVKQFISQVIALFS
ncbi:hypothetical protein PAN31117_01348 [Pandoraea anapnoica]|uniref:Uncharacterized protein n=1 Tax=Pandoraea anapnoica TaxID=2508301 RepID=A0A5E4ZQS0_9BURK|nr:hypothetical protein PAN31117_01348 [Pandoraea anapnoica]